MKRFLTLAATTAVAVLGLTVSAQAGTIILEGSNAIGTLCPAGDAAACAYSDKTFSALGGSSPASIAVIGATSSPITSATHTIVDFADLSTAGDLTGYSAIYFVDGNAATELAGRQSDVTDYFGAGGTIEIGSYTGAAAWDFLVGGSGNNNFVAGLGGFLTGPTCTDAESVTADGHANGFATPGAVGCWGQQAFALDHFAALGFTMNFFNADPAYGIANPGLGGFSSLLSNGFTITGVDGSVPDTGIPEPATWTMMLTGFGCLGAVMRRRRSRSLAAD